MTAANHVVCDCANYTAEGALPNLASVRSGLHSKQPTATAAAGPTHPQGSMSCADSTLSFLHFPPTFLSSGQD
jgi:hypothetical protein